MASMASVALVASCALTSCSGSDPAEGRATAERAAEAAGEARATAAVLAYQQALVDRRGVDAAALVTAGTIEHYEAIRQLALSAPPEQLARQTLFDRLTVALLRAQLPAAPLAAATPGDLFAVAVDAGLVGRQVGALEPRTARLDDDGSGATVELVDAAGQLVAVDVRREGRAWKVDLTGLIPRADAALRQLAVAQGLGEDELILATLSALTGRSIGLEVFLPPS
jgi:hypothetical protein